MEYHLTFNQPTLTLLYEYLKAKIDKFSFKSIIISKIKNRAQTNSLCSVEYYLLLLMNSTNASFGWKPTVFAINWPSLNKSKDGIDII
jgi:hypothetical protein